MKNTPVNIFWFRRDLRLNDNHGLYQALRDKNPVVPVFIFDKNILDKLSDKSDRRVEFIYNSILAIKEKLNSFGSEIEVIYSTPQVAFESLINKYNIEKVFTNHDYESYAIERDLDIKKLLEKQFHKAPNELAFLCQVLLPRHAPTRCLFFERLTILYTKIRR